MDNHFSVYDPVTALAAVDEHKAIVFVCLGIDAILSFLYFIIALRMTIRQKMYAVPFSGMT